MKNFTITVANVFRCHSRRRSGLLRFLSGICSQKATPLLSRFQLACAEVIYVPDVGRIGRELSITMKEQMSVEQVSRMLSLVASPDGVGASQA